MFLVKIFRDSFYLDRILKLRFLKFWYFIIYFFLISFVSLFSFNYANLKEGGWKLGFVEYNFISVENVNVKLPNDIVIRPLSGVKSLSGQSQSVIYNDSVNGQILYRFLINEEGLTLNKEDLKVRQLIFTDKRILYVKGDGSVPLEGDYDNFSEEVRFESINNITNAKEKREALVSLANSIEKGFGKQNAFFTIITYSTVQILLYILLIFLLSAILQLFRFGYTKFMSFFDGMKIVIATMTVPSVISFVIGFFTHALTPVIVQFGLGIILMIAMLKYGKYEFSA
jgi:maltodextrin utilization protein YvdJ